MRTGAGKPPFLGLMTNEELKLARKRLGLSQTALARRLGVGLRTYQEWESGEREMRPMVEFAISDLEHRQTLIPGKQA